MIEDKEEFVPKFCRLWNRANDKERDYIREKVIKHYREDKLTDKGYKKLCDIMDLLDDLKNLK